MVRKSKQQKRTDELFEAIAGLLDEMDASDEEGAIVCSAIAGYAMARMDETPEERISLVECMIHLMLGTMRKTLQIERQEKEKEEKEEAERARRN